MSFFRKNTAHRPRIAVVFDIGSASVGAGLLLLRYDAKPHILYQTRRDIIFQEDFDFERFLNSMYSALEGVTLDIVKNGIPHLALGRKKSQSIDHLVVSYASPWYISHTKEISITQEKPFLLTKDMVRNLIMKEEHTMIERLPDEYEGVHADQVTVIEKSVTNIQMNGYTVKKPYGKETRNVTLSLSVTLMAEQLKRVVTETIEKHIQADNIRHISFTTVGCATLKTLFPDDRNFLFLDISGEVTDISCIRDDTLKETVSFPMGTRHIVRLLMKMMKGSTHEVETFLALYSAGAMSVTERARFERALTVAHKEWGTALTNALNLVRAHGSVPTRIFLTADVPLLTFFQTYFESVARHERWTLTLVDSTVLAHYVTSREQHITDPFIALITLFIHTVDESLG